MKKNVAIGMPAQALVVGQGHAPDLKRSPRLELMRVPAITDARCSFHVIILHATFVQSQARRRSASLLAVQRPSYLGLLRIVQFLSLLLIKNQVCASATTEPLPLAIISPGITGMDQHQISQYFSQIGRKGGLSRAKRLTPKRRKQIATKASKQAAKARTQKANQKANQKAKKNSGKPAR